MPETAEVTATEPVASTGAVQDASQTTQDATPANDRTALLDSVEKGMAAVFNSDDADESSSSSSTVATTQENAVVATDGTTQTDAEAAAATTDDATASEAQTTDPNAPTLPDAYRRSLKAFGWTDDEINNDLGKLGQNFIDRAERLHLKRNEETQRWAEAGRASRQQGQTQQQQQTTQQATTVQALKPLNADALKDHYGDTKLIDEIVTPVNAAIKQINDMLPMIQQSQTASKNAELQSLGRQIEGFFGAKEMEPYTQLYGKFSDTSKLSNEQIETRNKVLEMADTLVAGAKLQGHQMSIDEALQRAHDSLSSGYKKTAARQEIVKSLQSRNKGITMKPTGRKAPATAPKAGDRTALHRAVGEGLAKVFA